MGVQSLARLKSDQQARRQKAARKERAHYEIEVVPNHKGVRTIPRKIVFG